MPTRCAAVADALSIRGAEHAPELRRWLASLFALRLPVARRDPREHVPRCLRRRPRRGRPPQKPRAPSYRSLATRPARSISPRRRCCLCALPWVASEQARPI